MAQTAQEAEISRPQTTLRAKGSDSFESSVFTTIDNDYDDMQLLNFYNDLGRMVQIYQKQIFFVHKRLSVEYVIATGRLVFDTT
jgi:hypothetical protein